MQVTSVCATCRGDELSLDTATFAALGGSVAAGQLAITYRSTECRPPAGITVTVRDYRSTDGGWLRLSVGDMAGSAGLAGVELRQAPLSGGHLDIVASSWRKMLNLHGALWELNGLPAPPLDLRLTNGAGSQILARCAGEPARLAWPERGARPPAARPPTLSTTLYRCTLSCHGRKVIVEAVRLGTFNSSGQFPLASSAAGMAAAAAASLALPEVSALALPELLEPVAYPVSNDTAGSEHAAAADEDGAAAAAAPSAEGEGEALLLPPLDADLETSPTTCNITILSVLDATPRFSTLAALIHTAGARAQSQGMHAWDCAPQSWLAPATQAPAACLHLRRLPCRD